MNIMTRSIHDWPFIGLVFLGILDSLYFKVFINMQFHVIYLKSLELYKCAYLAFLHDLAGFFTLLKLNANNVLKWDKQAKMGYLPYFGYICYICV